ncbi:hypothetical protein chiPu_0012566 [Chiloscyllium punctatum]|uniref:Uncharacterized protein n=1 Tax=Chiloscyllium punctatum TaxID=137246 RepID=A0A401SUQ5_CHIPU|nr:hypothetical protein [Chiloscyllium punctatum]
MRDKANGEISGETVGEKEKQNAHFVSTQASIASQQRTRKLGPGRSWRAPRGGWRVAMTSLTGLNPALALPQAPQPRLRLLSVKAVNGARASQSPQCPLTHTLADTAPPPAGATGF